MPGFISKVRYIAVLLGTGSTLTESETIVNNRKKDRQSPTGKWFAELTEKEPWYKDVVPDVRA